MKIIISENQLTNVSLNKNLNEQFWEATDEMRPPDISLDDAPEWFDKPSAKWLSSPTGGGGVYMDKYGSTYGKNTAIRKKPLSQEEKDAKKKSEDKMFNNRLRRTIDDMDSDNVFKYDYSKVDVPVGSDRMATISDYNKRQSDLFLMKKNYKKPLYTQNSCTSAHVQKCNAKNKPWDTSYRWIAVDVVKKGRDLDIETGNYSISNKGEYVTLGRGKWDNDDYTVCNCRKYNVSELGGLSFNPNRQEISQAPINYGPKLTQKQMNAKAEHARRVWYNSKAPLTQEEKVHRLLDVLAIGALLLPGGVIISAAIETVNAGIYFSEGDVTTGVITLVGAFALPGAIGAGRKVFSTEAKQIGKAWVGYSDDLAKGMNSTKAYHNNVGKITSKDGKLVFNEMATNPNYIKNQLGLKRVNGFNSAIKGNPQLAYKKIKTMPDVKKISGFRKNIKHAYTDEFITPLPVWLRGVLTGGVGTLYHFMTEYSDGEKDRELVKALMSKYNVPAKTKDGKSVEQIIVNSPAVKELKGILADAMKIYGGGDDPQVCKQDFCDTDKDPEVITKELLEKVQRLVKYVAKLPIEDLTERQLTLILQKHKSKFNDNIEYIISKIKRILPKIQNMEAIDLIDSEGYKYEKNNQSDIQNQKIVNLKGDNTYEYAKWGEYWFTRKKGDTDWKFLKTEIDKSSLEKAYKDEANKLDKASEGELDAFLDSMGF
jgi:hypothetical protein